MSAFNRREILRALSAGALLAPLALPEAGTGAPLFFTKDEFTTLDILTDFMIPADDHSPGARVAKVPAFIDKTVAEAFLPEDKAVWKNGLESVNALSKELNGKPFNAASKEQQLAVMQKMAAQPGENNKTDSQQFFGNLKTTTVFAYYTSSTGIHDEMHYKGNVLLDKFVGYLPDDPLPPIASLGTLA